VENFCGRQSGGVGRNFSNGSLHAGFAKNTWSSKAQLGPQSSKKKGGALPMDLLAS